MKLKDKVIIYQTEEDIQIKNQINSFAELAKLNRDIVNYFIGKTEDLCKLKIKIQENKKGGIIYIITLGKYLDHAKLKAKLEDLRNDKKSLERSYEYLLKEAKNIEELKSSIKNMETYRLVGDLFNSYYNLYQKTMEDQLEIVKGYYIKVKSLEYITSEDEKYFKEIEEKLLKNDNRMKLAIYELKDTWGNGVVELIKEKEVEIPENIKETNNDETKDLNEVKEEN